jgi:hypothetical protein
MENPVEPRTHQEHDVGERAPPRDTPICF